MFIAVLDKLLEVTGLKIERSKDTQKYTKLLTLSEESAMKYLKNNNYYFKLASYRKN